jgi:hypothetical protein
MRLVLYPLAGGQPRTLTGTPETDRILAWSKDGRALFVAETDTSSGLARRILRRDLATGRRELWSEIRPADQAGLVSVASVVSADGRAYAYTLTRCLSELYLVEGLK